MANKPMKESGVEWIGEIPKSWNVKKMSLVANKITDYVASGSFASLSKNVKYLSHPDYAMLIRTVDLSRSSNKLPVYVSKSAYEFLENSNLFGGEIILSNIGSVGNVFMYSPMYKRATLAPNSIMLDMKGENRFYYYWFLNPLVNETLKLLGSDSVQTKFNKTQLRAFKVVEPSLEEQQKIASFLDEKVVHIDNIIEDTKKSIEYLKAYKQSLITETVTKGLDANVEMKDSGVEWIGEIPKHWVLSKIKYRVSLRSEKELYQIGEKYIGLEHIESNNGRIHSYDEDYSGGLTDRFKSGDVLFSKLRPYLAKGFIASFDGYCSGELLTFKDVEGDKRYLLYYILSENFIDAINASTYGTKMPRANWDYIKELPIPCFPIYEQQVIAGFLDKKTSHIDSLIRNKKKMLQEIEAYKKSLIYEYVTGKKEVQ